jgi:hypothetical protein
MPRVSTIEEPTLEPYDIEQSRERVRSTLAVILIALVVLEIIGICIVGGWAILYPREVIAADKAVSALKEIAVLVLPPSIALASAVMGFYYASKTE